MGQMTIELFLSSLLFFSLVAALSSFLVGEIGAARSKISDFQALRGAESILRSVESAENSGAEADVAAWKAGGAAWRIESGRLRVWHGGRVMEVQGVFSDDASEPV